jgi:hypothetical protein
MTTPLCFHIEPFSLEQYQDGTAGLEARFVNFWAGVQYPSRIIARTRRFSFAVVRRQFAQQTAPLDDVRAVVPLLDQALATLTVPEELCAVVRKRLTTMQRVVHDLPDGPQIQQALAAVAQGQPTAEQLHLARDGCMRAIWPWRWYKNYRRLYEVVEEAAPPLMIDHYFLAWPEEFVNPESIRSVLKSSFLLPNVTAAPLPALFTGQYRLTATELVPTEEGQPYLRVLHAHDVRGEWDLSSWYELHGDYELAIAMDIKTLSRARAQRVTTDAYNVLEIAIYGPKAVKDSRAERAYEDVNTAMRALDHQGLHEVSYHILVQAPNLHTLNRHTQTITDKLGARLRLDTLAGSQQEYIKLFTPLPAIKVNAPIIRRNALSHNVAAKMPWGIRKTKNISGTMWGWNPFQAMPVHFDLFGETGDENSHLLMLGKSGYGKTVSLGMLALRQAVAGNQVVFFDPVGKVNRLCEAVGLGSGAAHYDVQSTAAINLLDPIERELSRQGSHVTRKLSIILGQVTMNGNGDITYIPREVTNDEVGALDDALVDPRIYGPDGDRLATMTAATAPLLGDLVAVLRDLDDPAGQQLAREIESRALKRYAHIYNRPTSLKWDFSAHVVGYNFKGADPMLLPMLYDHGFGALNAYIRSQARQERGKNLILIIDEYRFMAQVPAIKAEVALATKTWRNYGAGVWTCDQNAISYMGGSGDAREFASFTTNNTNIRLLGRQEGTDLALIAEAYAGILSPSDIETLRICGVGEFVGIFGAQNEVHHLRMHLTDLETPYFLRKY